MNCCDSIIKYLLFIFNLVFSLLGLAVIIAGSVLVYKASEFGDVLQDIEVGYLVPQISLIVLGVIIFIIACLGCCGAIKGNKCKLITYATLLLSALIVEIGIGIYVYVNKSDVENSINKGMRNYFDKMFTDPKLMVYYNDMQTLLKCCGVAGPSDYLYKLKPIPDSCKSSTGVLYNVGCSTAVVEFINNAGMIMGILGIILALVEIFGAAFALRLASLVHEIY